MWTPFVDLWLRRRARPNPSALDAIAGKTPVAVVTGGSDGIGQAIGARLLAQGKTVLLVARGQPGLERARIELGDGESRRCLILALDVTAPDAGSLIAETVRASGGYVDCLVNAAGTGASGPFAETEEAELARLVDLNCKAATVLMRRFLPGMLERAEGGVLNIASLGAAVPGPHQAAYYASKSYLVSLTEAVAEEIKGRGVRVTAVLPGPVETAFHDKMGAQSAAYRQWLPAISAETVARSALAGFARGQTIVVPGSPGPVVSYLVRVMPHAVSVPVTGWLLRHRDGDRNR